MKQQRNLDGVYSRVQREGVWEAVCFSDLTSGEQDEVLKSWDVEQIKKLAKILAENLYKIGEDFEITGSF